MCPKSGGHVRHTELQQRADTVMKRILIGMSDYETSRDSSDEPRSNPREAYESVEDLVGRIFEHLGYEIEVASRTLKDRANSPDLLVVALPPALDYF